MSLRDRPLAPSVLLGLLLASLPAGARADRAIERGLRAAAGADFEAAIAAFEEAEAARLGRDELVALYANRALAAFALDRRALMEQDLARLLALGADAGLPDHAPPEVREVLERLRREGAGTPRIDASVILADGHARIEARARGGADLVRSVRVWIREGGAWRAHAPPLERPLDDELEWYAEALGPSGVLLATEGTAAAPNLERAARRVIARSHDTILWGLATAGALTLTVAVVTAVRVATASVREPPHLFTDRSSDRRRPDGER